MIENYPGRSQPIHILDGFITEQEFADQRGVSLRTCQRDRARRNAPPHVVLGRQVFYRVEATRSWLEGKEIYVRLERGHRRKP
jgi:hypothetical protein